MTPQYLQNRTPNLNAKQRPRIDIHPLEGGLKNQPVLGILFDVFQLKQGVDKMPKQLTVKKIG